MLGVGKPVKFINALFDRAVKDPEIKLTIISALSLEKPLPGNELQNILAQPIYDRLFDKVVDFKHIEAVRKNKLPKNIKIYEWMFTVGEFMMHDSAQMMHVASNLRDGPRDIKKLDMNVFCHLAAFEMVDEIPLISRRY